MTEDSLRHKHFLRLLYRSRVQAMAPEVKRREALRAAQRATHWPRFQKARTVALTRSLPFEMDTTPLWDFCREMGKTVVFPRVDFALKTMEFFEPKDSRAFRAGGKGLLEPGPGARPVKPVSIDLVVVPGAAFTSRGERLGAGGGFYDRFLAAHRRPSLGLAHLCQMAVHLPNEKHDQRLDAVITSQKVHR